jgi:hypothetical protein
MRDFNIQCVKTEISATILRLREIESDLEKLQNTPSSFNTHPLFYNKGLLSFTNSNLLSS